MAITFLDAGTNATYGFQFWSVTNGAVTSSTAFAHTGLRSIQLLSSQYVWKQGILSDAGGRVSFYLTYDSGFPFPNVDNTIFGLLTSGGSNIFTLKYTTTDTLKLFSPAATQLGATSAALGLVRGTWARFALAYTITSATTYEIRVWVNGTLAITVSASGGTTIGTGSDGYYHPPEASNTNSYFSDDYVDDATTLTDPGDLRITAKLPTTRNASGFGTAVGSGAVNERALSETNGRQNTTAAANDENYTLEGASAGDVDLSAMTLVGRSAWIWAKVSTTNTNGQIMDNGSASAITLTTTSALYTKLTTSATYPSNAAGIGMRSSATAGNTFLYECGTVLAYTPAGGGGDTSTTPQRMVAAQSLIESSGVIGLRWK